jgi:hypothetical protein
MFQLVFFLFAFNGWCTGLVGRYQYLNTGTLPQDVWLFGLNHSEANGSGYYSAHGAKVSGIQYFSRTLNYSHLLDEVNDPLEKDLAEAAFKSYGRSNNEVAGEVINDVSINQKADAYVLGRGLTKKTGIFFIFPVVTINTKFRSRFSPSQSLLKFADQLKDEGQLSQSREILEKSESALRDRLDENGYNPNYPSQVKTLANVYVNYRYMAFGSDKVNVASDSFLVIPAGKKFDENNFIPLRVNEEQLSLKQNFTAEWRPHYLTGLLTSFYYHKRFPFNKAQRIPSNSVSPLSPDIDYNTQIKYGDTYGMSFQWNLIPLETFGLYFGQSLEFKQSDQFSGGRFSQYRYDYLEQNSSQRLGMSYLGFNVNTIPSFLLKKFLIPMDINLQYSQTNIGQNTFRNKTIALNMMVFYK